MRKRNPVTNTRETSGNLDMRQGLGLSCGQEKNGTIYEGGDWESLAVGWRKERRVHRLHPREKTTNPKRKNFRAYERRVNLNGRGEKKLKVLLYKAGHCLLELATGNLEKTL